MKTLFFTELTPYIGQKTYKIYKDKWHPEQQDGDIYYTYIFLDTDLKYIFSCNNFSIYNYKYLNEEDFLNICKLFLE